MRVQNPGGTASESIIRRAPRFVFGLILLFVFSTVVLAQIDVTRQVFTPPVVPETLSSVVKFEATVTGNPASVAFRYDNVDRPMFDNGTNGDVTAGDGTWTITFTANEILNKNTPARMFRPVVGTVRPAGTSSAFNVVGEVWTSEIGLRPVMPIDAGAQRTSHIVNFAATRSQLTAFNPTIWAQKFYQTHGDDYDFISFVLVGGTRGNRFHSVIKNTVQGIGINQINNSANFGSAGRLMGTNTFPIPSFYDGGSPTYSHEMGHQWINFLTGTPFAVGVPHWPLGNVATNVMGFSTGGTNSQGGSHPFSYTPNGSGGYVVELGPPINGSTFSPMELYLMGLAPPSEVGTMFILNNQNQQVTPGRVFQASELTFVTVDQIIAARGPRVPDSVNSQKDFRTATIVLSEQLLDQHAMSLYDYFTRRAESRQQLQYADGLATGTSNPWFLATGGRSTMSTAFVPGAAQAYTITGRVLTPAGTSIRNATVILTNDQGVRRTATTSSFGVYTFNFVPPGPNYTMTISPRRYRFAPKTLNVASNLSDVDFLGLE